MPGRSFSANSYRYGGAGGQEMDNEIYGSAGTSYTAEYWQYDSRLMRRWNVDPMTYPWQSSYAAFNNNPIYFIDPLGLFGTRKEARQYKKDNNIRGNISKGDDGIFSINDRKGGNSYFRDESAIMKDGVNLGLQEDGVWKSVMVSADKTSSSSGNIFSNTWNSFSNWWSNTDLFFNVQGKVDIGVQAGAKVQVDGAVVELEGSLFTVDLLGISAEQKESDSNPWEFDFDYVGEDGYLNVSQYGGVGLIGGVNYTHSFEGGINGGYRNQKHTTTVNAVVVQYKNEQTQKSAHNLSFTISGRAALILGIEGEVSFGVKDKGSFK